MSAPLSSPSSAPIAALGMYDRAETAAANDAFWAAIRARLGSGPERLTRGMDFAEIWAAPGLVMAQTCGMPYRTKLHGHVTLIGTPDYGLPDCAPGYYRSTYVVHADSPATQIADFAGKTLAYNDDGSQSGWAAPRNHATALGLEYGATLRSGGHVASALAVAEGRADIAAIDGLTWALIQHYDSFAPQLRALTTTPQTPSLPYITALGTDPKPLFKAISAAITDLPQATRDILHLKGLVAIDAADYLAVPTPPAPEPAPKT